jgi:hypothetical protein
MNPPYTPAFLKTLYDRLCAVDATMDKYRFADLYHTENVGVPGMLEYLQDREERLGIIGEHLKAQ